MVRRLGASLTRGQGFAPSTVLRSGATLWRALAIGLPAAAFLCGVIGVLSGLSEPTLTGLSLESPGGHVLSVDPTSLAWAEGIRAGQVVIRQLEASDPSGWALVTAGADGTEYGVSVRAAMAIARLGLVAALAAMLLGLLGMAAAHRHRRRAEAVGAIGLVLASIPLAAIHDPIGAPIAGTLATAATALWLLRWSAGPIGPAAVAGAVITIGAWLAAKAATLPATADLESLRFAETAALALVVIAIGLGMTPRAIARRSAALRYVDIAVVGAVLVIAAAVQVSVGPPVWVPVFAIAVASLVYGGLRREVRAWIDRVVFAEERERIAIGSAETERARLSRALHDDPLQALAGVILSLEHRPHTESERETLRTVAGQLRNIATALHPPVLDDLGLVPAVESLFAEAGPIPIELELVNDSCFSRSTRPPFEVELASYRIIAEATTNALRHSGCGRIIVRGSVSQRAVTIDVVDDGCGIRDREVEAAMRQGHLGVASMRRRAEAIDAELAYGPGPGSGTIVALRWSE